MAVVNAMLALAQQARHAQQMGVWRDRRPVSRRARAAAADFRTDIAKISGSPVNLSRVEVIRSDLSSRRLDRHHLRSLGLRVAGRTVGQ